MKNSLRMSSELAVSTTSSSVACSRELAKRELRELSSSASMPPFDAYSRLFSAWPCRMLVMASNAWPRSRSLSDVDATTCNSLRMPLWHSMRFRTSESARFEMARAAMHATSAFSCCRKRRTSGSMPASARAT